MSQVPTRRTTALAIMRTKPFARGFADVRAGIAFDPDAYASGHNEPWDYERGRQLAHLAPLSIPLRAIGGEINPKAVKLFEAAILKRIIL